jgi:hypothetical protein
MAWAEWSAIRLVGWAFWENRPQDKTLWKQIIRNWTYHPRWEVIKKIYPLSI